MGVMTGAGQCAESRVPNLHFTESRMQKITIFAVINVIILIIIANLTYPYLTRVVCRPNSEEQINRKPP